MNKYGGRRCRYLSNETAAATLRTATGEVVSIMLANRGERPPWADSAPSLATPVGPLPRPIEAPKAAVRYVRTIRRFELKRANNGRTTGETR
jgi:hypothetical protein